MNLSDISAHWVALHEALGLGAPIANDEQYEQLLGVVAELMERQQHEQLLETSPLSGLASLLADRIGEYEARSHPWPDDSSPATVLAFLMTEHGLRQSDLPDIGSQGVVSEILRGKRALNLRQITALSKRFAVPLDVFATR